MSANDDVRYDEYGFDDEGINKDTGDFYDEDGFDANGIHRDTDTPFNLDGYDRDGWAEDERGYAGGSCDEYDEDNPWDYTDRFDSETDWLRSNCQMMSFAA